MAKRIIEINGVNIEFDDREAKNIETFKVGDNVKVLVKDYGDQYKSFPGVIVGFDNFKKLPTIIVAYLETSYSSCEISYAYINGKSEEIEIVAANKEDVPVEKSKVIEKIDQKILNAEQEIKELENKKIYFEKHFGLYFKDIKG